MAKPRPKTIAEYIRNAPRAGQAHLRRIHTILEEVAPDVEQTIKWNTPFFVEPRFVFGFGAHKAHASFALTPAVWTEFREELAQQHTTQHTWKFPYDQPLPESLLRRIAQFMLRHVRTRTDDGFW